MSTNNSDSTHAVIAATQTWLDKAVIGLNLCPFAKAVRIKQTIRFVCSQARSEDELRADLLDELQLLIDTDPTKIETSLLIHPHVLGDFFDYNDFLGVADGCLRQLDLVGEIQIASFHPDYCFADSEPDAIDNHSNRSPFAMLHLLREASVEQALIAVPEAADIYERNIATLRHLGLDGWRKLFAD